MKKVFIATPTDSSRPVDTVRNEQSVLQLYAKRALRKELPEFVQSFFDGYEPGANVRHRALDVSCLKQEKLAESDCAIFGFGWDNDPECLLLKNACEQYSIPHIAFVDNTDGVAISDGGEIRAFCAVPMTRRSDQDVSEDISTMQCYARAMLGNMTGFVQSCVSSDVSFGENVRCRELASVNILRRNVATAHVVFFGLGWSECPMCNLLKSACEQYGIPHYTAVSFHTEALEGAMA